MKPIVILVIASAACGGRHAPDLRLAVGAHLTYGYGACQATSTAAITAAPAPDQDGVRLEAKAPGALAVDCADDSFDTTVRATAAVSYELVPRGAPRVKVGDALPELCVMGRDAAGRLLELGDAIAPTFVESAGTESLDGGPHGSVFSSARRSRSCHWGTKAIAAGALTVTATWNGQTAAHTLTVEAR